jgi:hypothetical protein
MFPANSWNLAWGGLAIRTLHAEPKADIELRIGDEPRARTVICPSHCKINTKSIIGNMRSLET